MKEQPKHSAQARPNEAGGISPHTYDQKDMIRTIKNLVKDNPTLARAARAVLDNRHYFQKPTKTPHGFLLVGNEDMMLGRFEIEETDLIAEMLGDSDVLINIGANIGYYCCLALHLGKQVVAVEPMPRNLRCLCRNLALNGGETSAEVHGLALSDKVGLMNIYGGGTTASLVKGWSGTPEAFSNLVPVNTLDNIVGERRLADKRLLVLVDVEGAELFMLKGATEFLARTPKPRWIVEITISEHLPKGQKVNPSLLETFGIFWNRGYKSYTADKEKRPVLKEELMAIVESGIDTTGTHNFLFEA